MRVDISEALKNPGINYSYQGEFFLPDLDLSKEMGCALSIASPVILVCGYSASGDIVTFRGEVSALIKTECALCLDAVTVPVKVELFETFSKGVIPEDEAMEIHPFDGTKIDLTEGITASILLDLPMRIQCGDNCKGLCPTCGKNLNHETCGCENSVKTAFAALASLSFDQEEV